MDMRNLIKKIKSKLTKPKVVGMLVGGAWWVYNCFKANNPDGLWLLIYQMVQYNYLSQVDCTQPKSKKKEPSLNYIKNLKIDENSLHPANAHERRAGVKYADVIVVSRSLVDPTKTTKIEIRKIIYVGRSSEHPTKKHGKEK